ncbi:MAG: DUF4214 domain-containing protein, partial [Terriglobia bacterium]
SLIHVYIIKSKIALNSMIMRGLIQRLRGEHPLEGGASRQSALAHFAGSPEAQRLGNRCPIHWTEEAIRELLEMPAAQFVAAVWRSFLWREPEIKECEGHLANMRQEMSKMHILHEIASSSEARRLGHVLPDLQLPTIDKLLGLPEPEFPAVSFKIYFRRSPSFSELSAIREKLQSGISRMSILFQLYSSAKSSGIDGEFPADWIPKTIDELQTIPGCAFAQAAFRTFFWRDPDPLEQSRLEKSLAEGMPRMLILYRIARSPEGRMLNAHFPSDWAPREVGELLQASDSWFLTAAYRSLLWRDPDPGGIGTWTAALIRGAPRGFVLHQIAISAEAERIGAVAAGGEGLEPRAEVIADWTPKTIETLLQAGREEFLDLAYRSLLWRSPDTEEIAAYSDLLSRGVPRSFILYSIASSHGAESVGTVPPHHSKPMSAAELLSLEPDRFIAAAYRSILWRAPDIESARRYAKQMQFGRPRASILREIAMSDEALRIPRRIVGLESLPAPRLSFWYLLRLVRSPWGYRRAKSLEFDRRLACLEEKVQTAVHNMPIIKRDVLSLSEQGRRSDTILQRSAHGIDTLAVILEALRTSQEQSLKTTQQLEESAALSVEAVKSLSSGLSRLENTVAALSKQSAASSDRSENQADLLDAKISAIEHLISSLSQNGFLLSHKLDNRNVAAFSPSSLHND